MRGMMSSRPWKKTAARTWSGCSRARKVTDPNSRAAVGSALLPRATTGAVPLARSAQSWRIGPVSAPTSSIASTYHSKWLRGPSPGYSPSVSSSSTISLMNLATSGFAGGSHTGPMQVRSRWRLFTMDMKSSTQTTWCSMNDRSWSGVRTDR